MLFSDSIIASPGCSSRFLLREADLPPVQLERSGWFIGVCVSGRHSGFSGLHWWKQDPGHPQSPPPAAHTTPTEVCSVCAYRKHPTLCHVSITCICICRQCSGSYKRLYVFVCVFCRVISRAPGLKLVVETLITSLRPIGNIVLICCAFFIVFGILGVQVVCIHTGTFSHKLMLALNKS